MPKIPSWVRVGCVLVFLLLLFILGYVLIITKIAVSNFTEAQTRAGVARTLSDLRTMGIALETYAIDNKVFPPMKTWNHALTTPLAYLSQMMPDVFDKSKSMLGYRTNGVSFVVFSRGPDRVFNIDGSEDLSLGMDGLKIKVYDVTNGTVSSGDVVRYGVLPNR